MSHTLSVETLFFQALEVTSVAERATFLDSACKGDAQIRSQVDKLLRAHLRSGFFLTRPAFEQFTQGLKLPDSLPVLDTLAEGPNSEDCPLGFLKPSMRPDSHGRMGHYEVLEVLGRGGFGIVLRAIDETLQREVAIKVLAPQFALTASARKQFFAEARSSAGIRHVNVVQVYAIEDQVLPYLVMELIPGETLQQRLNRTGPLKARDVAVIGRQIAEGLAAAHAIGLIHRDVKPENILLESRTDFQAGEIHVKISDFGLARAADETSLTQFGIVAGTPMYMAPEQALGEKFDHRADLFSLGSVLYTMCCGQEPFRGKSSFAVLRRVVEETPTPVQDIVPETPQWLCDIITRLHAKKPEDRFESAKEVADLLGRQLSSLPFSSGSPVNAPVDSPVIASSAPPAEKVALPRGRSEAALTRVRAHQNVRVGSFWTTISAALLMVFGLGFAEAAGVTDLHSTIIRLFSPEGTLLIEVDDPGVSVKIDGAELVITGAGVKEIRLKPGKYNVEARKDGQLLRQEVVSVTKNGRQVVRVIQESPGNQVVEQFADNVAWERYVAGLPVSERVAAVIARLKELNPGFDGWKDGKPFQFDVKLEGSQLKDISPLRVMPNLTSLFVISNQLVDLSPLQGLPLTRLALFGTLVPDLKPLQGLKLTELDLSGSSKVNDLSPLAGMPLKSLTIAFTTVSNLAPLQGMQLYHINIDSSKVSDLTPLKGMPLKYLLTHNTEVFDLSLLGNMPLVSVQCHNSQVGDTGLANLKDCKSLTSLNVTNTKVTASGIAEFKKALPNCRVTWDADADATKAQ